MENPLVTSSANSLQPNNIEEESELSVLERHLAAVSEKISLCREMLVESPGIAQDELLSSVVGFLEACR